MLHALAAQPAPMAVRADAAAPAVGWPARLRLVLAPGGTRTRIVEREHHGPLLVQRPFYPEGDTCHVLLLHPPGGMVGHDTLDTCIDLQRGARALFTTPGAAKLYRSAGRRVQQVQHLNVAAEAALEWLPQPLIVYSGAHGRVQTRVHLAAGARFIGWDLLCLGRPASGETFADGWLQQDLAIYCADRAAPRYREAWTLRGGAPALHAAWGLGGRPVLASLLATPATHATLDLAREVLAAAESSALTAAATLLDELLVLRVLATGTEVAHTVLETVWGALRPGITGRAARRPRIWNT